MIYKYLYKYIYINNVAYLKKINKYIYARHNCVTHGTIL